MKSISFKSLLPHLIAIAIFLIVAVVFCKPALEKDLVLQQSDIAGWQGMSHQSFQYKEAHGHFPLWASNMFSGMPAYQIAMDGPWTPLSIIHSIITLWMPIPISFFFLACISFYFLCLCLRIKPWAAILGALAFAYCSFDPIIITAGHNTQMFALAYAPALLGAVILIYEKKYISGFVLTALFTAMEIFQNHQQISYYLFIIIAAMSVAYIIRWVKEGTIKHLAISLALTAVAGILGIMVTANNLLPVYDYAKESKRAGQLVMDNGNKHDAVAGGKTTGLSKDYAFQWSYGKEESLGLMFPGVQGYGMYYTERDGEQHLFPKLDENSHVAKFFIDKLNVPEDQAANNAMQMSTSLYWGDQPSTVGPVYLGAVICFLFIFGLFYLDSKHKWWLLGASVFGIVLAWGSHFAGFNYFMFDHLPLYNKFRVPTMAMVIPQLLFPIAAALVANKLMDNTDETGWKKFRMSAIATAAVFLLVGFIYLNSDFSRENKDRTKAFNEIMKSGGTNAAARMDSLNAQFPPSSDNRLYENIMFNSKGDEQISKGIISALHKDRSDLFSGSLLRSLVFVLIALLIIGLYLKKKINAIILISGLTLATAIDLLLIDSKYLNEKSFDSKDKYEAAEFPISEADKMIMADKDPNFRVYNEAGGDPFQESKTSYYHKSIGGYHPAKLGIYDDLAANQLSGNPNVAVLNMLNTKYVIRQNQQGNAVSALTNPGALGNCWFIKSILFVKGPVEEMRSLNNFNPRDTAFVDESFKSKLTAFTPADSLASIRQTTFDNDAIQYESNATGSHAAIFSEVYYKDWKAYIDGKPADCFKANYVLRGLVIPAGKHTIDFKFEPAAYYLGITITKISSAILSLLVLGYLGWLIWGVVGKKKDPQS